MHRWLAALFVCSCASAQPVLSLDAIQRDAPDPGVAVVAAADTLGPSQGDTALLFQVNGLSLNAYAGGFGGKWWVGSTTALTAGLQFRVAEYDREATERVDGNLNRDLSTRLVVGSEFHTSGDRLSPFVSVEAGAGFSERTYERETVLSDRTETFGTVESVVSVSGAVGVGVEYRLSDRFSLAGQQSLRGEIGWGTETRTQGLEAPLENDISQRSVTTGGTSLILAVYF